CAVVGWLLPTARGGRWAPGGIEVADLARRGAIQLGGAESLRLDGAPDEVPTVEDVGRGEFPVLAVALALKVFGASAWAARLPLALWTLVGAAALYELVRRLESKRVALLSVVVLVTSPLVFLHSRTALGEAITLASITLAFSGVMLAWADDTASRNRRLTYLTLGLLGVVTGVWSRGVLIGAGLPLLSAGSAWLIAGALDSSAAGFQ